MKRFHVNHVNVATNPKRSTNSKFEANMWIEVKNQRCIRAQEGESYLVSWKMKNGQFSEPIKARFDGNEEAFFESGVHSAYFPLRVDIYMKYPKPMENTDD